MKIRFLLAIFAGLIGLSAHGATIFVSDKDGVTITDEDILADMRYRKVPQDAQDSVLRKVDTVRRIASNLYIRRILARQAEQQGLDKTISRELALIRERALSEAVLVQAENQEIDPKAVERLAEAEYKGNPKRFEKPEEVRIRHILIEGKKPDARKLAETILEKAKAPGADFAELAKQHSDDPGSKDKGGDLGFTIRGRMVKPVDDAAFGLGKPGDISDIVESKFGFHIIRLEERRAAVPVPFEDVKAELFAQATKRILAERRNAVVAPIEQSVPFDEKALEEFVTGRK